MPKPSINFCQISKDIVNFFQISKDTLPAYRTLVWTALKDLMMDNKELYNRICDSDKALVGLKHSDLASANSRTINQELNTLTDITIPALREKVREKTIESDGSIFNAGFMGGVFFAAIDVKNPITTGIFGIMCACVFKRSETIQKLAQAHNECDRIVTMINTLIKQTSDKVPHRDGSFSSPFFHVDSYPRYY